MTPSPSPEAIHEAAHAAVGLYVGLGVGVVRLTPNNPERPAYVVSRETLLTGDPDHFVPFLLGGRAGQRALCQGAARDPALLDEMAADDIRKARALLEALDPETADQKFTRAAGLASAIVITHQALILAIAVELDRRRVLDAGELREIIARHQEATR